jgi:hypothetical protein
MASKKERERKAQNAVRGNCVCYVPVCFREGHAGICTLSGPSGWCYNTTPSQGHQTCRRCDMGYGTVEVGGWRNRESVGILCERGLSCGGVLFSERGRTDVCWKERKLRTYAKGDKSGGSR